MLNAEGGSKKGQSQSSSFPRIDGQVNESKYEGIKKVVAFESLVVFKEETNLLFA